MGEAVKIVDLAQDLIRLSGLSEHDIEIVFTGVRPGEKLEEKLFDPGMETQSTSHPDVLQVVGPEASVVPDLDWVVGQLEEAANRGDRAAISVILFNAIPGSFLVQSRHGLTSAESGGPVREKL
jgi:O-antigen biosynthesis protein WbqV